LIRVNSRYSRAKNIFLFASHVLEFHGRNRILTTMALGIIIHITVGTEKRTEFFSQERIRVGSDELCDLQIHMPDAKGGSMWFDLDNADGVYRVIDFDESLGLRVNDKPIRRFIAITDGDTIASAVPSAAPTMAVRRLTSRTRRSSAPGFRKRL